MPSANLLFFLHFEEYTVSFFVFVCVGSLFFLHLLICFEILHCSSIM